MKYHEPVMAKVAIEHLKIKENAKYIDATLGDGGHTLEIIKLGGKVLGIDRDKNAIVRAKFRLEEAYGLLEGKFVAAEGNFKDIEELAKKNGFEAVSGILYDVGTSLFQLEDDERGFSYGSEGPLDMRADQTATLTASDLVNGMSEEELTRLISEYGGEHRAKTIAKAIVTARKVKRITQAKELADVIESVISRGAGGNIHPATRTFQALRIAVNDELDNLEKSLTEAASLLLPGGRLAIITFHSLEDQIAKRMRASLKEVYAKPLMASEEEIKGNNRARSAKLRVFEK